MGNEFREFGKELWQNVNIKTDHAVSVGSPEDNMVQAANSDG